MHGNNSSKIKRERKNLSKGKRFYNKLEKNFPCSLIIFSIPRELEKEGKVSLYCKNKTAFFKNLGGKKIYFRLS
jgi:hypothetical protein